MEEEGEGGAYDEGNGPEHSVSRILPWGTDDALHRPTG